MKPRNPTYGHAGVSRAPHAEPERSVDVDAAAKRRALVQAVVKGAVLPSLLARKDRGAFDRGPNVLRFPHLTDI